MDGATLKTFVEEGLDAGSINETAFYQKLNAMKTLLEEERNWKILETDDSLQTASSGDTFLSMKTLPSTFGNDIALFVVDGNNNPVVYYPIPFRKRYEYKDASRRYYIDLKNGQFALTGKLPTGYTTIHLIYRAASADITSGSSWVFPSRFHALLGYLVAASHKGGADWDVTTARQALQNSKDGMALYQATILWNDNLIAKEQGNQYETAGAYDSDGLPTGELQDFPLGMM